MFVGKQQRRSELLQRLAELTDYQPVLGRKPQCSFHSYSENDFWRSSDRTAECRSRPADSNEAPLFASGEWSALRRRWYVARREALLGTAPPAYVHRHHAGHPRAGSVPLVLRRLMPPTSPGPRSSTFAQKFWSYYATQRHPYVDDRAGRHRRRTGVTADAERSCWRLPASDTVHSISSSSDHVRGLCLNDNNTGQLAKRKGKDERRGDRTGSAAQK